MYLDLLTTAHLVDPSVWASPDVLAAAVDHQARRTGRGGGFFRFIGGLCCVGVIAVIALIVWLIVRKKKQPPADR
ncbi:hypothetical protein D5S18_12745 [Nocardia panacis]|uniref:Uncharacterized protein n=1 Tax=Nocardia panacis TaxID=2340916 RepID=A0A3A4K7C3_9NOCA|nr:hypothetical protein [Nocardia panacis]RJO77049.1 hypothetical protein D5S18_12745 [Nocardia panacis]